MNYYDTLIARALSGGGGGGGGEWFGTNPVLLDSWDLNIKLSDTSYSTWTPSTSTKSVRAPDTSRDWITVGPTSKGAFEWDHEYVAVMRYCNDIAYKTGASGTSRYVRQCGLRFWSVTTQFTGNWVPGYDINTIFPNAKSAISREISVYRGTNDAYLNSEGAPSYGVYFTTSNPGLCEYSSEGDYKIRLNVPSLNVRASNSYMPTSVWQYVDADNTTIKAQGYLYQVDKSAYIDMDKELAEMVSATE